MSTQSLWWRALVALGLMVGFYVLSIGVAVGLLAIPYLELRELHRLHLKLLLFCGAGAIIILWSILPRPDRFTPPGALLTPESQPRLFEEIRRIASRVGQRMPKEIYLVPDMNAFVAERGGMMGLGSRRIMGLGLPLLSTLTVTQLRSVLVHEFGHFHGGDTKLGPWVYKTRSAIGRTLQGLSQHSGLLLGVFTAYAKLFLRVSHAVSRGQELSADKLAALTVGARPLVEGLSIIHRMAPAYESYWSNEVAPVLQAGFRPPLEEGFGRFVAAPSIREGLDRWEESQRNSGGNPYDTHPPLPARIDAVQGLPPLATDEHDDRRAIELLDHGSDLEGMLLSALAGSEFVNETPRVEWEEVGEKIFVPLWRRAAGELAAALKGTVLAELRGVSRVPDTLAGKLLAKDDPETLEVEVLRQVISQPVGVAVATALLDRGGSLDLRLGETEVITLQGETIRPFRLVQDLATDVISKEEWDGLCERLGIGQLDLGEVVPDARHCPHCHEELTSHTAFCASCGVPVPKG